MVASPAVLRSYLAGAVFGTSSGTGPPRALLLHGWRRTKADFARVSELLAARGVPSLALDLPGFGDSPPPQLAGGARHYATLLAPLVTELAAESGPLLVVGHSFGGRVGVCLAARAPAAMAGAVLSGVPLIRDAMPSARPARRYLAIRALARHRLVPASVLESARQRYGSDDYRAASGVMRDVLVATVVESYEDELRSVRCPINLLWGDADTVAPLAVAEAAAACSTFARVEVLHGTGHFVPTEAPEQVCAAAVAMLEEAR